MTKDEAINWIINISADIGEKEHRDLWHYEQALSEIREMLETAQPEPHWIPCSERLPDVRHNILITDGYHTAEGQLQDNGDWVQYRWTCLRKHDEIIAWMPLPEGYRGEQDENR